MRIDKVYIKKYKNLIDFQIDLNQEEMKTILIGQNATGKSNFLEAIILIFKNLDLSNEHKRQFPEFDFNINYKIDNYSINIENKNGKYIIYVDNANIKSLKEFFSLAGKKKFQPKYVFTYYSGLSNKLNVHFWDHQNKFYEEIIKEDFADSNLDLLRKLFYVQLVHSYFVLLAYFSYEEEEKESIEFLNSVLNITDIESILFILKKPEWAKNRKESSTDPFWTSKGLVRKFLDVLWDCAVAPIYHHEDIRTDFRSYDPQDRLYLFIKDKDQLKKLAENYKSNTEFFKALESTYISKLIAEVRIKVKKKNIDGSITFKELSEGEQQLLTVLGLLKFTKDENSLILLDEPDTHLNPLWKWRYLEFLDKVVNYTENTQIIINTHDPLVIGSLKKEEVRIFRINNNNKIYVEEPDVDPREMSVAGILTSELFGLPSIMSKKLEDKLNRKRYLQTLLNSKKIKQKEKEEYEKLSRELEEVGFYDISIDSRYNKFIELTSKHRLFQKSILSNEEEVELERISKEVADEVMKKNQK